MDAIRNGNFTSSEVFRLFKPGKGKGNYSVDAETYIEECNRERRLMRSIEIESDARPLLWGKACEPIAFNRLPLDYTLCSDQTIQHPTIPCLVGTPDATTEIVLGEVKCPMTLTSFCQMVDPWYDEKTNTWYDGLTIEALRGGHKDGNKFYYQSLSNAILTGKSKAQLIIFVPYEDELEEIRQSIEGNPKYYWLWMSEKEQLPYLIKGAHYKNINLIEFDIFDRDVSIFENRVKECGEKLIPFPKQIIQ